MQDCSQSKEEDEKWDQIAQEYLELKRRHGFDRKDPDTVIDREQSAGDHQRQVSDERHYDRQ